MCTLRMCDAARNIFVILRCMLMYSHSLTRSESSFFLAMEVKFFFFLSSKVMLQISYQEVQFGLNPGKFDKLLFLTTSNSFLLSLLLLLL